MAGVDFAALLSLDELVAADAAKTLCWFAGVLRDLWAGCWLLDLLGLWVTAGDCCICCCWEGSVKRALR
jgi:hypothetical protein